VLLSGEALWDEKGDGSDCLTWTVPFKFGRWSLPDHYGYLYSICLSEKQGETVPWQPVSGSGYCAVHAWV